MSYDKITLFSYELVCEQFFEKIKDSPSLIKFNNYAMLHKKIHHVKTLERVLEKTFSKDVLAISENLVKNVLRLL